MLRENVLTNIFFGNTKTLSPIVGALSVMPVKKSRLGLLNPVIPAKEKYLSSQRRSAELIRAVMGGGSQTPTTSWCSEKKGVTGRKNRDDTNGATIKGLVRDLLGTDCCLTIRSNNTGDWLSVHNTTVTSTVFLATEFRDFLCASYNVTPLKLQGNCD